jgi:hypothetical protein
MCKNADKRKEQMLIASALFCLGAKSYRSNINFDG